MHLLSVVWSCEETKDENEEQLVEICQEVGPVVSFRLVIDRETGKPKGYGFCEYKDEETALSARRNFQGYEINGRQLRVDFAENDKGTNRSRDQGRGGPGLTANVDPQKQGRAICSCRISSTSANWSPYSYYCSYCYGRSSRVVLSQSATETPKSLMGSIIAAMKIKQMSQIG